VIAPFLSSQLLNLIFRGEAPSLKLGALYLSLHSGEPGSVGESELAGEGYRRQPVAFAPSELDGIRNQAEVEVPDLPEVTVKQVGFWTAREGGYFLWGVPLEQPKKISNPGDTLRIPARAIEIALGGG
jgi:hypothetical protein